MRLALSIGPATWLQSSGVDVAVERVQRAEALGFDSVWATEDPDGWDAFAALSLLAGKTSRIHLGSGLTNPYLRHPNLIAASIATLQRASGGRAFLGIGRGEPDWYRRAFGMEIGSPLKRVRETIDVLHQWWGADARASNDGEFVVRDWRRSFSPGTPPPIYIGATGRQMLAQAGAIGDGVRFNVLSSPELIRDGIGTARDAASAAGRVPDALRMFASPSLTITRDPETRRRAIDAAKTTMAYIHVLPGMDRQLLGLEPDFEVATILSRVRNVMRTEEVLARGGSFADLKAAGDLSAAKTIIPDDLVLAVAAIGTWNDVEPRLRLYADAGVTDVFASPETVADDTVRAAILAL